MNLYNVVFTIVGFAALAMAWMPSIAKKIKISYSVFFLAFGVLVYLGLGRFLPLPDPISKNEFTLHITELAVIVSLMGSGLKIDDPFSIKRWIVPFRLVSITMLLTILGICLIGRFVFGFDWASSILLGAVLAPTDPVLASDVQVEPPNEGEKENVKFALTAEAGMNDGTAFPFTWLAIGFAASSSDLPNIGEWILVDLLYKILAGIVIGILAGRALGWLLFKLPEKREDIIAQDGFVSIAATLLVYGFTELIHAYGFIAVFVCAVTIRNVEIHHKFHKKLHSFSDQVERVLVVIVLILFGGSLVSGLLDALTWQLAIFGLGIILFIRPLAGFAGLVKTPLDLKEKFVVSFYGIKGMGTFFYLAFAFHEITFRHERELWALAGFVVLLSVIVHGLTAGRVIEKIEQEH